MRSIQGGPILFRNTMQITTGHLESFQRAIERAVRFVEENGPQLMVDVFIDEQHLLAYSFQLYHDSESILEHWRMSDPYIREVMKHCTVQQLDVYGQPNKTVKEGLTQSSGDHVTVTVTNRFSGFTRLPGRA